jgi:hypothetical protein
MDVRLCFLVRIVVPPSNPPSVSGVAFISSILQRAELAFPGEGVGDDGCEIVELRPPPQQVRGAVGLRHDPGRIAGSSAGAVDAKIHARHNLGAFWVVWTFLIVRWMHAGRR